MMGSLISGLTGSAKKARRAQQRAAHDANIDLDEMEAANLAALQPQIDIGGAGLNALANRLGLAGDEASGVFGSLLDPFTGADLASTPGYQFGLEQGGLALDRQAAARGGLISGAALKAAQRFGQDYAGTKFNEGFNRDAANKERIANFLGNVSNIGSNAINQANATRTLASQQYGQNTIGAGNAVAASHLAQGNIWDNVLNTGITLAATGAMGGFGGLGGLGGASGAATTGGMTSTGAMRGFSQNLLNPNFAKNYMGLG